MELTWNERAKPQSCARVYRQGRDVAAANKNAAGIGQRRPEI